MVLFAQCMIFISVLFPPSKAIFFFLGISTYFFLLLRIRKKHLLCALVQPYNCSNIPIVPVSTNTVKYQCNILLGYKVPKLESWKWNPNQVNFYTQKNKFIFCCITIQHSLTWHVWWLHVVRHGWTHEVLLLLLLLPDLHLSFLLLYSLKCKLALVLEHHQHNFNTNSQNKAAPPWHVHSQGYKTCPSLGE